MNTYLEENELPKVDSDVGFDVAIRIIKNQRM